MVNCCTRCQCIYLDGYPVKEKNMFRELELEGILGVKQYISVS